MRSLCKSKGWEAVDYYFDVKSGTAAPGTQKKQRNELHNALERLSHDDIDGIIIVCPSRLSRDMALSLELVATLNRRKKDFVVVGQSHLYVLPLIIEISGLLIARL